MPRKVGRLAVHRSGPIGVAHGYSEAETDITRTVDWLHIFVHELLLGYNELYDQVK